jgi:nucleoside-diphosphate-sugar epimerase
MSRVTLRIDNGVDVAIVHIFNTFGPRMSPDDGRAIPTFIGQALRGQPLTVAGDGTQTRRSATSMTSSPGCWRCCIPAWPAR